MLKKGASTTTFTSKPTTTGTQGTPKVNKSITTGSQANPKVIKSIIKEEKLKTVLDMGRKRIGLTPMYCEHIK